ncbi:MAG: hypothetical protein LWX56_10385 [Ignavibacteria bacterium]|nr:hypothetical protein [Ignavibacteria bacterium]
MTKIISLLYIFVFSFAALAQSADPYTQTRDTSRASLERCFGSWHYEGSVFNAKPPKGTKNLKLIIAQNQIQLGDAINRVKSWDVHCFDKHDLYSYYRLQAQLFSPKPWKVWVIEPEDHWVKDNIYKNGFTIYMGLDNDKLFVNVCDEFFIYRRDGSKEMLPTPASEQLEITPCNLNNLFGTYRFVKGLSTGQDDGQWGKYDLIITKDKLICRDTEDVYKWVVHSLDAYNLYYEFHLDIEKIAPNKANVCALCWQEKASEDITHTYCEFVSINENEIIYRFSNNQLYLYRKVK